MTWPVRVVVYGAGGVVVMGFVVFAMRRQLDGQWCFLAIPPSTAILGDCFPRAADALFAWVSRVVLAVLRR